MAIVSLLLTSVPQGTNAQTCPTWSNISSSSSYYNGSVSCWTWICYSVAYSGSGCSSNGMSYGGCFSSGSCSSGTTTSGGCTVTTSCTLSCFAADSTVETQARGVISIKDIREGEMLKAWSVSESREVFSRFTGYSHADANQYGAYIELITSTEKSLKMTAGHLMAKLNAEDQTEFVFASQIKVGDRVLTSGGQVESIVRLDESVEKGVYSPMTAEGTVIVNNMVASCYSNYNSHEVAHLVHPILLSLGDMLNAVLGYKDATEMAHSLKLFSLATQLPFLTY